MFSRLLFPLSLAWVLFLIRQDCTGLRLWEYEPLSFECTSSDPTKLNFDLQIVRVRRGEFAISGTVDWNYDVDNTTMIEAVSSRSDSGAETDYVAMPWGISKQTFQEYIDDHYKQIVYKNIKSCSNMPKPDSGPWPHRTFKFDKCVFSGEGMPDVMPDGYLKFAFTVTGQVDWTVVIIIKVIPKLDMFG